MNAIETQNLSKVFGDYSALQDLTFQVPEGTAYGVLGPSGAGKTTLLHTLMGFLKPSSGKVRVLGTTNLEAARDQIGYLPARLRYHLPYTPREYLFFLGQFSDMSGATLQKRIGEELERVGLSSVAHNKLATFSRAMLQRLGIAQALLAEPDLLLIDEPTSGLDGPARQEMIDILHTNVCAQGYTLLICSHHVDEIEQICDQSGVLVDGRLIAEVDVRQLRGASTSINIQVSSLEPELRTTLSEMSPAVQCGERIITLRPNSQALQENVLRALLNAGVTILSLEPVERPLHHIYMEKLHHLAAGDYPSGREQDGMERELDTAVAVGGATPERSSASHLVPTEETDALLRELLKGASRSSSSPNGTPQDRRQKP